MRVGLAVIGAASDADRLDTVADGHRRHVAEIGEEFLEPGFEVQAVAQDEIRVTGFQDIARCRLVAVDFGARLGDAFDIGGIAGDVLRDIRNNREGVTTFGLSAAKDAPGSMRARTKRLRASFSNISGIPFLQVIPIKIYRALYRCQCICKSFAKRPPQGCCEGLSRSCRNGAEAIKGSARSLAYADL